MTTIGCGFWRRLARHALASGWSAWAIASCPTTIICWCRRREGTSARGLGWAQATWAARFNRRHRRSGHLLQGRFKAHLVDADAYARQLVRYVHLNPVRPRDRRRPVPPERREAFEAYRWSSHRAYAGTAAAGESPQWLSLEWLNYWQEAAGRGARLARVRRAYRADLASCFGEPAPSPWAGLRGGLVLGGEELWKMAQALLSGSPRRLESEWAPRHARTGAAAGGGLGRK